MPAHFLACALCGCTAIADPGSRAGDPAPARIAVPSMDMPETSAAPLGAAVPFTGSRTFGNTNADRRATPRPRRTVPLLLGIGRGKAAFALFDERSHPIAGIGDSIAGTRIAAIGEDEVRLADGRTVRIAWGSSAALAGAQGRSQIVVPDIVEAAASASPQPEVTP